MIIFKLPDLGEGLPDAEIQQWYVAEGDDVKIDQPIVAMETAKAVVDVPSPQAGRIAKLYGKPGDVIKTGEPLLAYEGEEVKDAGAVGEIQRSDVLPEMAQVPIEKASGRLAVKAIPAVRALAVQLKVDLNTVTATGSGGAITADDVRRAASAIAQPEAGEALHGARRMMALQMAKSHTEVVPVTLTEDADLCQWPEDTDTTVRLIRAIIAGCAAVPVLNAHFYGSTPSIQIHKEINLGIAVDTPEALYVPVIKNAAHQTDQQLREIINHFKAKAKAHHFIPDDLKGATITLTNFGTIAGRYSTPIILPPMVAIVGFGKKRSAVVACKEQVAIHPILPVSLSFDHRAITGGEGARFLAALLESLEKGRLND